MNRPLRINHVPIERPDVNALTFYKFIPNNDNEDSHKMHVWHIDRGCFEKMSTPSLNAEFSRTYSPMLKEVPNFPLYIETGISPYMPGAKLLFPCPKCVIAPGKLPKLNQQINVYKRHLELAQTKPITSMMVADNKPILRHFAYGKGTFWVTYNSKTGEYDKYADLTPEEEKKYLPNKGVFSSYFSDLIHFTNNSRGYDGFESEYRDYEWITRKSFNGQSYGMWQLVKNGTLSSAPPKLKTEH